MIDEALLQILACPNCESRPPLDPVGETLKCRECGRVYPIVDGVPNLLPESAIEQVKQDA